MTAEIYELYPHMENDYRMDLFLKSRARDSVVEACSAILEVCGILNRHLNEDAKENIAMMIKYLQVKHDELEGVEYVG